MKSKWKLFASVALTESNKKQNHASHDRSKESSTWYSSFIHPTINCILIKIFGVLIDLLNCDNVLAKVTNAHLNDEALGTSISHGSKITLAAY